MKPSIHLSAVAALTLGMAAAAEKPPVPPKVYPTPLEAGDAFIDAARKGDTPALVSVFGDQYESLMETSEPARDKELRAKVAAMAMERRRFRFKDADTVTMVIGAEAWPFPIPLVKADAGWRFDPERGFDEILKRRVGENELSALASMRAYVKAQQEYAAVPRDGGKVRQYAARFISSPGKHDGLHWPADSKGGGKPSPAGDGITGADKPHNGYHFKILTAQGEAAPGGKYDYRINGHLIGGFALIAWPAEYGKTGVMSFIVNQYGDVHERDLGEDTARIASETTEYNPTTEWKLAKD